MDRLVAMRLANPGTSSTARSSASPSTRIGYKPFLKVGVGKTIDYDYETPGIATVPSTREKKETKSRKRYDTRRNKLEVDILKRMAS